MALLCASVYESLLSFMPKEEGGAGFVANLHATYMYIYNVHIQYILCMCICAQGNCAMAVRTCSIPHTCTV